MTNPRAPADSPCESTDALLHESVSSLYDLDWEGILKAHPYIGDRIRRAMKRNETDAAPPVLSARPNEADGLLRDLLHWAESRCPCDNDLPKVCPLCRADVDKGDACRAVPVTFPRDLLERIRAAAPKNEADAPRGQPIDPRDKPFKGLYDKYRVERTDGSSGGGCKHEHCEYFVIDLTHDRHAYAAIDAYARSCVDDNAVLANDLWERAKEIATREAKEKERAK